jgi:hypothetical protein
MSEPTHTPAEIGPLELAEKGRRGGQEITLDRRLYMKFTAFGRCGDPHAAIKALAEDGVNGALYVDINDPQGIGIMVAAEDPDYFVTTLRTLFGHRPFADYTHKAEFDMLGRTYSIGYEADLEDTLLVKPQQKLLNPAHLWAVWYPLQRRSSAPHPGRARHAGEALRLGRPCGRHSARVSRPRQERQRLRRGLGGTEAASALRHRAGNAQDGADIAVPR